MDVSVVVSLVVGVASIILAVVAIWYSRESERKSVENYNRTKDVLSEISQKAAVIEGTVSKTQEKLVDTVTAIASPKQETQDEIIANAMLPFLMQNPEAFEKLVKMNTELEAQQGKKT